MARDRSPRPADRSEPTVAQRELVDALGQSAFVIMGALTRIAADHELSLTQLRVLGILRDRRLRMAQLADFLGLDRSTMSGLIERAERRGLVARVRNVEDGRAIDVFMTDAGRELAERVQNDVHLILAPMTGRLEPQQQRLLTQALQIALAPGTHDRSEW